MEMTMDRDKNNDLVIVMKMKFWERFLLCFFGRYHETLTVKVKGV